MWQILPFHLRLEVFALFLLLHEENIPPRETDPYLRGFLSPSQPLLKSSTRESLCPLHFQYCSSESSVTSRGPVAMEAVRSDCGFSHYLPQGGGRARSLHYAVFLIPERNHFSVSPSYTPQSCVTTHQQYMSSTQQKCVPVQEHPSP